MVCFQILFIVILLTKLCNESFSASLNLHKVSDFEGFTHVSTLMSAANKLRLTLNTRYKRNNTTCIIGPESAPGFKEWVMTLRQTWTRPLKLCDWAMRFHSMGESSSVHVRACRQPYLVYWARWRIDVVLKCMRRVNCQAIYNTCFLLSPNRSQLDIWVVHSRDPTS